MSGPRRRALGFRAWAREVFDPRQLLLVLALVLVVSPSVSSGAEGLPGRSGWVEVPGLRSATSETFVSRDGSFETRVYEHPVHFRGARDVWERIDATFAASGKDGFAFASGANGFSVEVKAESGGDGLLRYSTGAVAFALGLEGARAVGVRADGENGVAFDGALPNVDVRYALLADGLKETVVLRSAQAPSSYRFVLTPEMTDGGLRAVERDDGSIAFFVDGRGQPAFVVLAPTVADSSTVEVKPEKPADPKDAPAGSTPETGGRPPSGDLAPGGPAAAAVGAVTQSVSERPDGSFEIVVQVDESWLADPARVFPVFVDPTISQADVSDGYWNAASGTSTPNLTDGEVLAGYDGTGANFAAVMTFDLAVIPPGAQVTAAQIDAYATRCIPTNTSQYASYGCPYWWLGQGYYSSTMELFQVTSAWGASTQWQNVAVDGSSLGLFAAQYYQSTGTTIPRWITFSNATLASRVQALVNGTTINNGFVIKKTAGDTSGLAFAGSRYADVSKAPRLVIQWVADGVYLSDSQHVRSDGAELSWTRFDGGLGPYGTAVMADAPVAYWRFDDPATNPLGVSDWSGNGQHAGASGIAFLEAGATADGDQSLYFSGSAAVERSGGGPVHQLSDTFSAELWIKRQTLGGRQTLIARGESNGGGLRVQINPSNQVEFGYGSCYGCQGSGILTTSTVSITDTTGWHQIVVTKQGSTVKLYIDGVDRTGGVSNATLTSGWDVIAFGRNYYHPDQSGVRLFSDHFSGWIDEPAFYSFPLSGSQVSAHYAAAAQATVAFDRYEVHRSTSAGFTPSASTLVATIKDRASQLYRDTTAKPSTTFYYKVQVYTSAGTYTSNQIEVSTPAPGYAQITIQPDVAGGVAKTSSISSTSTCSNQGGAKSLTVDATNRALLHFDLRAIPSNVNVTAATLSLFTFSTGTGTIVANRVTADWTEGSENGGCGGTGASWASRQPSVAWATAGADFDTAGAVSHTLTGGNPGWDTWSVQPIVQGWLNGSYPNLGLLLKHQTEAGAPLISYPSDEYTSSYPLRPKLAVTYQDGSAAKGPQVAIGSPGASSTVKGTVTVSAAASDDGRVSQVQFKLDGSSLGAADTTAPYSVSWDTTSAARGAHSLTAVSTDDAGNTTVSQVVPVTVANSAAPSLTGLATGTPAAPVSFGAIANLTADRAAADEKSVSKYTSAGTGRITSGRLYLAGIGTSLSPSTGDAADGGGYRTGSTYANVGSGSFTVEDGTFARASRTKSGPNFSVGNGFVRFDTSSIPDGATVTSAQLKLAVISKADANTLSYVGDYYDFGGEASTSADWTAAATADAFTATIASLTTGTVNTFALSNLASVSRTAFTGIRLKISQRASDQAPTGTNEVQVATSEHATLAAPQLVVNYTVADQEMRMVVYADASGSPGTLLGASETRAFPATLAAAWQTFTFPDGVAVTAATQYWIGLQWGANAMLTAYRDSLASGTAGSERSSSDSFADGPSDPFGSATQGTAQRSLEVTVTADGDVPVSVSASDDFAVSKVEFLVDGDLFATDAAAPYAATLSTLAFPVYDGSHTLTARAYDADGNVTTSAGLPLTVANTSGSLYKASITSAVVMPEVVYYDPALGSQDATTMSVTLQNLSSVSWPDASTKLRYRWITASGSVAATSADISIGGALGAGGTRVVSGVSVVPPTLPAGVHRARYRLRIDLFDTVASSYFAAKGNQPLEYWLTVSRVQADELGLERYQQYDGEDLGGGVDNAVNLANGNNVVQWVPFNQPGRGLNTVVSLSYNGLEVGSTSPMGNGWSLAISSLSPFGTRLDVHPNAADTAAGRTLKWIGLVDADGSYHRFVESATANVYTEPAGVNLYLRDTLAAGAQRYKLVKPDRTVFWYGDLGYPTSVSDQDGNTLSFTLSSVAAGDDAYGASKQITQVTDAGGRSFTIAYYLKSDTGYPAVRGKVKSITDHANHRVRFDYYNDGNLLRATEEGGTNADGSYLADRALVFTYVNTAGSGAAIGTYANRVNPDPATVQGSRLFSTIDFKGGETTFAYATTGATAGRVTARTNRSGDQTAFAYDTPAGSQTTVTMPLSRVWVYTFDSQGRVTVIDDPANPANTTVSWTADNMPLRVSEPTGAFTEFTYNANGYLTSKTVSNAGSTQQLVTSLTYDDFQADASDPGTHLSRVKTITQPVGNATGSNATDYKWSFAYVDTLEDHVLTVTGPDPDGAGSLSAAVTTNAWNANGTLLSTTLPANGDGITRTTTYNSYDANGLPTQVTDAAGGVAKAGYLANGNLEWLQDPNHAVFTGGTAAHYQQQFFYDSFGRLGRSSQPKSAAYTPGLLIWTDTVYDANDNVTAQLSPHYGAGDSAVAATTTVTYDAMDRPRVTTGPRAAAEGGPVETEAQYDAAGRVTRSIQPNGRKTGGAFALDYVTDTVYDLLDRVSQSTSYAVDAAGAEITGQRRTTVYCYDLAGDLRSVTGPKANNPTPISCPAITTGTYTPTSAQYTGVFEYDFAHRQTKTTDPLGNYTKTVYNENGAPTSVVDWVNGVAQEPARTTTFTYNDRGEKTVQVSPFDSGASRTITSKWTYDTLGNVAKTISPRAYDTNPANPTQYVQTNAYDALNRLSKVTLPTDGSTAQAYLYYAYDANGNQTMVSLPTTASSSGGLSTAERTTVSYWDTGAIYSSTDPANPTVRFDYTAEGWQSQRVPEQVGQPGRLDLSRTMYWDYLPDGLLKALRDLGGQRASYAYDANGNRTQVNEANGITQSGQTALNLTSAFTGFNELKSVAGPKFGVAGCTQTSSFTYDLHGNLATLAENLESGGANCSAAARSFAYGYDAADRLTDQTDDFRTSGTSTDDEQFTFTYRPAGWLDTRVVNKRPAGSWVQEQKSVRSYFDNGQLKQLTNSDGANTLIEDHQLSYITGGVYLNGNRASDTFKLKQADGSTACFATACTASWVYDARDRLVQETPGTPGSSPTSFSLDVIGNALSETTGASTVTRTFNGQQLATLTTGGVTNRYLYDPYGNVDCVTASSWAASSCPTEGNSALLADYIHDYANRLTATRFYNGAGTKTDTADYVNDPLDRPVQQTEWHSAADSVKGTELGTTTTTFTYLGVSNAVTGEVFAAPSATKTRSYAYDGLGARATLSETIGGTTNRYSYLYDPHGSVSLLLDQTNGVKASYGYSAYGNPNTALTKTAAGFTATTNPYRYTGKRFDTGSNTLDMGARRYSASAGRFLQYDQYTGALDNLGLSLDPINANRYAFTGANPVNYVEWDGHRAFIDGPDGSPEYAPAPEGSGAGAVIAEADADAAGTPASRFSEDGGMFKTAFLDKSYNPCGADGVPVRLKDGRTVCLDFNGSRLEVPWGPGGVKSIRELGRAAARGVKALKALLSGGRAANAIPALRQAYLDEVAGLASVEATMRAEGAASEQIARVLHAQRRALGVKYKDLTPEPKLSEIYARNQERYGDPLGPSIKWLRNRGKSWEDIIASAKRPGGKDLGF